MMTDRRFFPTQRKSAIITVTFNRVPNLKILQQAAETADYIIICDNGSDSQTIAQLVNFCNWNPKFILLRNNANMGTSRAYNKAVAFARQLGVFWLCFFDDDAQFDPSWLRMAMNLWHDLEELGLPVGILVPIVSNDPHYLHSTLGLSSGYSLVSSAITSGLFTNAKVFDRGYNPEFFLDWADIEFTWRVRQNGYLIIRLNKVMIIQDFGLRLPDDRFRNRLINAYSKLVTLSNLKRNRGNLFTTSYSIYMVHRRKENLKAGRRFFFQRMGAAKILWPFYLIQNTAIFWFTRKEAMLYDHGR
jgi:GT2 family glycosyltransferase